MVKILLGPAGSPTGITLTGISAVKELGLHAMEVQFTHGIKMSAELAAKIGEEQKRHNIALSIHAPYYINLISRDESKIQASKKRILDSCYLGHLMHATKVVFHPGYYGSHSKEDAYDETKLQIKEILGEIKKNRWNTEIAPETTGRDSQFGTLEETLRLAKELGCSFCIDVAHLYARNQGRIDFKELFDILEGYGQLHFQFSGVEFGKGGEKRHLILNSKPDFYEFAKELLSRRISATIISESPVTWEDSLKMKAIFEELGHLWKA